MRRFLQVAALSLALGGAAIAAQQARLLGKANLLPLALSDDFEFRKTKLFLNDPKLVQSTGEEMITFERQRANFGAITSAERRERQGHYFTFFWKAKREADITIRLEYRQTNLADYVQAQEIVHPAAKGSMKSEFRVRGDDYLEDGRVTAWRALLIENGKVVGLTQSFLWK
jgi:hypothetical protein